MANRLPLTGFGIDLIGGLVFSLAMPHEKTLGGLGLSLLLIGWLPGVFPFHVLAEVKREPVAKWAGMMLASAILAIPFDAVPPFTRAYHLALKPW